MAAYQERSQYEASRRKRDLYQIGIALNEIKRDEYTVDEFSTVLVFNYLSRPVKTHLQTKLLGFAELDEFLSLDLPGLHRYFERRFPQYRTRLIIPKQPAKRRI